MRYLTEIRRQGEMMFLIAAFSVGGLSNIQCSANDYQIMNANNFNSEALAQSNQYVGMWVTKDAYIRQELLPNGRYDEARGDKKSAYQGRYEIKGNHIDYWDDTGFTADGEFRDGVLYHGGYVFYKEKTK